jgi:hypothetical protein
MEQEPLRIESTRPYVTVEFSSRIRYVFCLHTGMALRKGENLIGHDMPLQSTWYLPYSDVTFFTDQAVVDVETARVHLLTQLALNGTYYE